MTSPRLVLAAEPSPELTELVRTGIRQFNGALFPEAPPGRDLAIAIVGAEERPLGGLLGRTAGGWLAIELVFVPETLRGQGLATRLIRLAEEEAVARGCHAAWLDTLNGEALRLYESLGYRRFGELQDYPPGNSRVFLRKALP